LYWILIALPALPPLSSTAPPMPPPHLPIARHPPSPLRRQPRLQTLLDEIIHTATARRDPCANRRLFQAHGLPPERHPMLPPQPQARSLSPQQPVGTSRPASKSHDNQSIGRPHGPFSSRFKARFKTGDRHLPPSTSSVQNRAAKSSCRRNHTITDIAYRWASHPPNTSPPSSSATRPHSALL